VCAADYKTPDVVVLEMQLAAHSGSAFLYEFRTYSDWIDIPIIVHTLVPPDTTQVYEQSLKSLGVTDILYKPQTSLRKLLGAIEAVQLVR
jgi:response regulator RpfG family c-di-GMP phosphodiesterase